MSIKQAAPYFRKRNLRIPQSNNGGPHENARRPRAPDMQEFDKPKSTCPRRSPGRHSSCRNPTALQGARAKVKASTTARECRSMWASKHRHNHHTPTAMGGPANSSCLRVLRASRVTGSSPPTCCVLGTRSKLSSPPGRRMQPSARGAKGSCSASYSDRMYSTWSSWMLCMTFVFWLWTWPASQRPQTCGLRDGLWIATGSLHILGAPRNLGRPRCDRRPALVLALRSR